MLARARHILREAEEIRRLAKRATDPDNREPETGQDNPEEDAIKGPKTFEKIKKGEQDS